MNTKGRLIWDDCQPTRDRRPTTSEDIEDDIHVVDYDREEDVLDELLGLAGYDEEDLDFDAEMTIYDKIEKLLSVFDDPGDGSPNILYASLNGEELDGSLPYDCLDGLDLETITEDEVIKAVKGEFVEDDDDDMNEHFWSIVSMAKGDEDEVADLYYDEDEAIEAFADKKAEGNSKYIILQEVTIDEDEEEEIEIVDEFHDGDEK